VFQRFGLHRGYPIEVEVKSTGERVKVAPRDMLAALMPDPKTLAGKVEGAACLAVVVRGLRDGAKAGWMFWQTMDHQETFRRHGFNASSYPVGAPMAMSAEMIAGGRDRSTWCCSRRSARSRTFPEVSAGIRDHDRRETTCVRSRQIIDPRSPGRRQGSSPTSRRSRPTWRPRDGDVMQGIERAIVESSAIRLSSREAKIVSPSVRHVERAAPRGRIPS